MGSPQPKNKKLYDQVKREVYKKHPQHSAYRSGLLVREYKRRGGTYSGSKKEGKLGRWFEEDWRNQRGGVGYQKTGDVYRPTKVVTKDTPTTFSELSESEIRRARKEKQETGSVRRFKRNASRGFRLDLVELPNEFWEYRGEDGDEYLFLREDEDPNSDRSLLLSFDDYLKEYQIHYSEGADYSGHFGVERRSGDWTGSARDANRLLRAAEGMYSSWSRSLAPNRKTDDQVYKEWKKLVNMSARDLRDFANSEYGKVAGLSRAEASAQGIRSGRDSAQAILRMKAKPKSQWNDSDWAWARRQVAFIKRMRGNRGPLEKPNGEPTRKLLSLLIWGHNPL